MPNWLIIRVDDSTESFELLARKRPARTGAGIVRNEMSHNESERRVIKPASWSDAMLNR